MKELLIEFLQTILNEQPRKVSTKDQAAGTVEKTAGGRWRAKQIGTNKVLYWGDEQMALAWAKGKRGDAGGDTRDASIGSNIPKGLLGPKGKEPSVLDKPGTSNKTGVTDGKINPDASSTEIVNQLESTNKELTTARRRGRAGAGGKKASYGEVVLTEAANAFKGEGMFKFLQEHATSISEEINKLNTPLPTKRENTTRENRISAVGIQLGLDPTKDRDKIVKYLAAREVYVQQELEKLRADKASVLYLSSGFDGDEAAAAAWAEAQFDGAITTLQLIEQDSKIDKSKPFTVIQAEGRDDSHDGAIKEHLRKQIEIAQTDEDRAHYEEQLYIFEHLGFHDTMAVGVDEKNRLTIYHISNKKGNDLEDIWNNTGPLEAIKNFQESFTSKLADVDPEHTALVGKTLAAGVTAVEDSTAAAGMQMAEMSISEEDDFVKAVVAICSGKKDYTRDSMPAAGPAAAFERMVSQSDDTKTKKQLETLKLSLQADGELGIKTRLAYTMLYMKWVHNQMQAGVQLPKSLKITGNMIRLATKLAEELPKLKKQFGDDFGENSEALSTCQSIKRGEKEMMEELHKNIVKVIVLADQKIVGSNPEENGPHTQAYLGSVMSSMHFDSMVINFDGHLGTVTGIRGSSPADFRTCLAEMSGFEGKTDTKEDRIDLMNHLLKSCRINPTTYAIEITNKSGTHTLAEDSWRTSGTSRKIEKKLGGSIRDCVKKKADARRKSKPSSTLSAVIG